MIVDLEDLQGVTLLRTDICIIGGGAAGITLAREFIGTKHEVVLLESGGRSVELASQVSQESDIVGLAHDGIHAGRARALGGTTLLWAGQALPLFDIDFEYRDWVPYSGWPISRASLTPYYRRAEKVLNVNHTDNSIATWPNKTPPLYDHQKLFSVYSQFSPTPNFAKNSHKILKSARNISVVLHANVTSIEPTMQANSVQSVRAKSLGGSDLEVKARFVIICAGGIESARCLLNSTSVESAGIGNSRDVVGRFFQDHPGVYVPVKPVNKVLFREWTNSFRNSKIRYGLKTLASQEFLRSSRLLNVGAEIAYPPDHDDALLAAKTILRSYADRRNVGEIRTALSSVAKNPGKVAAAAYAFYVRGQPASVGRTEPCLDIFCEQQPNPDSRVTLSHEKDRLGVRKTVLDWRLSGNEAKTAVSFSELLKIEWARLGIATVSDHLQTIANSGHAVPFRDYNHHIGTCRMGADPRTSVVDADCIVHGYDNLYVGSSATFPTGGCSNPTMTIIALTLRIADDIKSKLMKNYA